LSDRTIAENSIEEKRSMWMGHDFGWWALVISVLALVLAYPLDLAAHLTAPKLKNWWAERSVASTRRRLEELESQLAEYEAEYPQISEVEELCLEGIQAAFAFGVFALPFLVAGVLMLAFVITAVSATLPQDARWLFGEPGQWLRVALALWAGCLLVLPVLFVFVRRVKRFRMTHGPASRRSIRSSIEELRKKLEGKNHA
jgi:hypothetical protein